MELSGKLSSLNIGSNNESNNEEKDEVSSTDATNNVTLCANCGKEGGESMNTCNNCDLVVYCNVACKKKHRSKHKKKCEKRAAELYDKRLFKEPPPRKECPICMLLLPLYENQTGMTFYTCCGKSICSGCVDKMEESGAEDLCPFCKAPPPRSNEEEVERTEKLVEKGNAHSFYQLGGYYAQGIKGLPQDRAKANELFLKAGELGSAVAYFNLGCAYQYGDGVEIDEKKAKHYWELAAMNGDIKARHNLGCKEFQAGNHQRAIKHLLLAAKAGYKKSLDMVKGGYMAGDVTKVEYANTLREFQKSQVEMKSDARDKALAARNERMGG